MIREAYNSLKLDFYFYTGMKLNKIAFTVLHPNKWNSEDISVPKHFAIKAYRSVEVKFQANFVITYSHAFYHITDEVFVSSFRNVEFDFISHYWQTALRFCTELW